MTRVAALLATAVLLGSAALTGCAPSQRLVLDSTFDGPQGAPAPAPWVPQLGGGGWGNEELQTYTDRAENVSLDGDGNLRIVARQEPFTGADGIYREYTSARVTTKEAFTFQYGRVEAWVNPVSTLVVALLSLWYLARLVRFRRT